MNHAAARSSARRVQSAVAVVAVTVLVGLTWKADMQAAGSTIWLTLLDVAVGLAFLVAGRLAAGPRMERVLFCLVGVAWLIGSGVPALALTHQAVLAVALLSFPFGRVTGWLGWTTTGGAALVAFQLIPQLGVAMLFAWIAIAASLRSRSDPAVARFPTVAASALTAALLLAWSIGHLWSDAIPPSTALIGYAAILIAIAAGFPPATRSVMRARQRLVDQVLPADSKAGLDGLVAVLQVALDDPDLTILPFTADSPISAWQIQNQGAFNASPVPRLIVSDERGPVALVESSAADIGDPRVVAAVSAAVRLEVTHVQLLEDQALRVNELQASMVRILAAADRQRERAAAEIRHDVEPTLLRARSDLAAIRSGTGSAEVAQMLGVVEQELKTASSEMARLVAGVPPAGLGTGLGTLRAALRDLTSTAPIPVLIDIPEDIGIDPLVEVNLYYCCSEAVTNALKHAGAARIVITVRRAGNTIEATIQDDGRGGADPSGSGLRGLADRIAANDGRLRVDSPPRAGTTVRVTLPLGQ